MTTATRTQRPRSPDALSVQERINYDNYKKIEWRNAIMAVYRKLFNQNSIPANKQYWTMPNKILNKKSPTPTLLPNCEFDQIIKAKFAKPNQCYGVEISKAIAIDNMTVPNVHSFNGDFLTTMDRIAAKSMFNPAIVSYDAVQFPETTLDYFPRIIYFLTAIKARNVMAVWNFVIKARYHEEYDINKLPNILHEHPTMTMALINSQNQNNPWKWTSFALKYRGSGKGHQSTMATAIYYRK